MKDKNKVIKKVADKVKNQMIGEGSGHDWWHVYRVWQMARRIGKEEKADLFVVELAALLHDIADWKFNNGDETAGPKKAREILNEFKVEKIEIDKICRIIETSSFKGAGVKSEMETKEGEVVQDSDRLDAIGAIGIARTFAYGGYNQREIFDPQKKPVLHKSKEQYMKNKSATINHFYEKLLLIRDLMNTKSGKKIAALRHKYLEEYLEEFYREWEGKA